MLNVFGLNPAGPLDRLTGYWYATGCRVSYRPNAAELLEQIGGLIGPCQCFTLPGQGAFLVGVHRLFFADTRTVFFVEGTTQWDQYLRAAIGSVLTTDDVEFDSSVSLFFQGVALGLLNNIRNLLPETYVLTGHSLGGTAAAMVSGALAINNRARFVIDFGSPRHGDWFHARAQTVPRLRVTNFGDPVPLIPPPASNFTAAFTTPLDPFISPVPILYPPFFYRHWGHRVHLWVDGSATRPQGDDFIDQPLQIWLRDTLFRVIATAVMHEMQEYARRLRSGIPVPYPALEEDPDYPGLPLLDQINNDLNLIADRRWFNVGSGAPAAQPVFQSADPCRLQPLPRPAPGPPSVSDPSGIPGLIFWFDAGQGVFSDAGLTPAVDTDLVHQWHDRSGLAHHLTQATSSKRPTWSAAVLNGEPAVSWDGVDDRLAVTFATTVPQPTTIFAVVNYTAGGEGAYLDGAATASHLMRRQSANAAIYAGADLSDGPLPINTPCIVQAIFDGAASKIRVNGGAATIGNAGSAGLNGLTLGNWGAVDVQPFLGYLPELCGYSAALDNAQSDHVGNYLATKYGLAWSPAL